MFLYFPLQGKLVQPRSKVTAERCLARDFFKGQPGKVALLVRRLLDERRVTSEQRGGRLRHVTGTPECTAALRSACAKPPSPQGAERQLRLEPQEPSSSSSRPQNSPLSSPLPC